MSVVVCPNGLFDLSDGSNDTARFDVLEGPIAQFVPDLSKDHEALFKLHHCAASLVNSEPTVVIVCAQTNAQLFADALAAIDCRNITKLLLIGDPAVVGFAYTKWLTTTTPVMVETSMAPLTRSMLSKSVPLSHALVIGPKSWADALTVYNKSILLTDDMDWQYAGFNPVPIAAGPPARDETRKARHLKITVGKHVVMVPHCDLSVGQLSFAQLALACEEVDKASLMAIIMRDYMASFTGVPGKKALPEESLSLARCLFVHLRNHFYRIHINVDAANTPFLSTFGGLIKPSIKLAAPIQTAPLTVPSVNGGLYSQTGPFDLDVATVLFSHTPGTYDVAEAYLKEKWEERSDPFVGYCKFILKSVSKMAGLKADGVNRGDHLGEFLRNAAAAIFKGDRAEFAAYLAKLNATGKRDNLTGRGKPTRGVKSGTWQYMNTSVRVSVDDDVQQCRFWIPLFEKDGFIYCFPRRNGIKLNAAAEKAGMKVVCYNNICYVVATLDVFKTLRPTACYGVEASDLKPAKPKKSAEKTPAGNVVLKPEASFEFLAITDEKKEQSVKEKKVKHNKNKKSKEQFVVPLVAAPVVAWP